MNSGSVAIQALAYDVFVSYARKNERYARELQEHLKGLKTAINFNVFIDKEELRTGDELKTRIEQALRTASIFIIVATPYYFASDWAFPREYPLIKAAVEASETKRIMTLVYEECDFLLEYHRLNRYVWADFSKTQKTRIRLYNKLMEDLYKVISSNARKPDSVPALDPTSESRFLMAAENPNKSRRRSYHPASRCSASAFA